MKFAKLAVTALALIATPVLANDAVVAGAKVTGPQGNEVGTIVSVENGQAVLDTGKHKVPLGVDMYGTGPNGLTITVTKDQLDSMVDAQLAEMAAKRDAALVSGAEVMTADHQPLGSIVEVAGDNVVIARGGDAANKVTLLREHFDATDHGLMARLTMAQIDAATKGSAGSAG